MEKTIGKKLLSLRKQAGFTQEFIAEKLGVSAQAVSKWENDIACPDIMILPQIAELYNITIDELFNNPEVNTTVINEKCCETIDPVDEKELIFKVIVDTVAGDNVRVNLPFILVKELVNVGKGLSGVITGIDISGIDLATVFALVENGVIGEIVNVHTQNGDDIKVVVE